MMFQPKNQTSGEMGLLAMPADFYFDDLYKDVSPSFDKTQVYESTQPIVVYHPGIDSDNFIYDPNVQQFDWNGYPLDKYGNSIIPGQTITVPQATIEQIAASGQDVTEYLQSVRANSVEMDNGTIVKLSEPEAPSYATQTADVYEMIVNQTEPVTQTPTTAAPANQTESPTTDKETSDQWIDGIDNKFVVIGAAAAAILFFK